MNDELFGKLMKMSHLLRRWQRCERENTPFTSHSGGQGRVIKLLQIQPEMPTKDLSYLLDIRQQSLNELLNKLEKGGYVERRPSENDRRVMIVHLTEEGKKIQLDQPDSSELFNNFTEEEMQSFSGYIDKLTSALEEKTADYSSEERKHWMDRAESRMGREQMHRLMRYADFPGMPPMPPRPDHFRGLHPEDMPHPGHFGMRPEHFIDQFSEDMPDHDDPGLIDDTQEENDFPVMQSGRKHRI